MQQYDNKPFQAMLIRAKKGLFNNDNVAILNSKIAVTFQKIIIIYFVSKNKFFNIKK